MRSIRVVALVQNSHQRLDRSPVSADPCINAEGFGGVNLRATAQEVNFRVVAHFDELIVSVEAERILHFARDHCGAVDMNADVVCSTCDIIGDWACGLVEGPPIDHVWRRRQARLANDLNLEFATRNVLAVIRGCAGHHVRSRRERRAGRWVTDNCHVCVAIIRSSNRVSDVCFPTAFDANPRRT